MNNEENQFGNYTYDVGRTKKTSNYNQTDEYLNKLMSNYVSEWCANFNVHSVNVLTMRQPGYIQPGNILLDDGNTIFETLKKHQYRIIIRMIVISKKQTKYLKAL